MIKLLKTLVDIPSISGDEAGVADYLTSLLKTKGYKTIRQSVDEKTYNIFALRGECATVLLSSHMDTVAPFVPFRRSGDVLYGRGACDAKGQIVAMIHAGDRLAAAGISDFGLLFVVGEESTSRGAKKAAEMQVGSKYVVIGEPTDNTLAVGQKGVLVFDLSATGSGGHSSLPELGESAIHKILGVLHAWLETDWGEDPLLGQSLLNIGTIHGGVGMNVLAPEAKASGIFRVATSLAAIHEKIYAALPDDVQLSIPSQSEPQQMVSLPGFETKIVGFGTDAAHLRPLGDIILYGPGSIQVAHRNDEHISVAALEKAVHDYVKIVALLLEKKNENN